LVRLFLTPEHHRGADLGGSWMRAAGLSVSEDRLGTLRGRSGDARLRLRHGARDRGPDPVHRALSAMSDYVEINFTREIGLLKALVRVIEATLRDVLAS
jgi:hypothetical protein